MRRVHFPIIQKAHHILHIWLATMSFHLNKRNFHAIDNIYGIPYIYVYLCLEEARHLFHVCGNVKHIGQPSKSATI